MTSLDPAIDLLAGWLAARLDDPAAAWVQAQCDAIAQRGEPALLRALGAAPRRVGKADLAPSSDETAAGLRVRSGLDASAWSVDEAARVLFLLEATRELDGVGPALDRFVDRLAQTADLQERIALNLALALWPARTRPALLARAREGVRSSVRPVFESIAHRHPLPAEGFDEAAWNQMIVKALFVGAPLWPVQGLARRVNAALTASLVDLAHERWAAHRAIPAGLWLCVRPDDHPEAAEAMCRALGTGSPAERQAVLHALREAPDGPAARELRALVARVEPDTFLSGELPDVRSIEEACAP